MNRDFDYHLYLATLESDGQNYTRLFGGSYLEVPAKSFGILRNDLAPKADVRRPVGAQRGRGICRGGQ